MCKGCGTKIVQAILFVVNFLVWVTGIVLIGVGAYALVEAGKWEVLFGDENTLRAVAGFMLGVGVIICIVGFCGCCGAVKKSGCLLKIYFSLVLLIIVLEVVAGILAFVYQQDVERILKENIIKLIEEEYTGEEKNVPTETIDLLQETFDCCGSAGFADWENSNYTVGAGVAVPMSCCKKPEDGCNDGSPGNPDKKGDVFAEGCLMKFEEYVTENYLAVGGVCIGLLVFEILACVFACCLIRAADDED
ncbi:CD151 antigen-like isoform X2 [Amphiura filiformis]|uniref:CD151 antigen-like isoform X2 n=1 Tax=Amphiura filiformis TaxID=82378 RepID=UPI003B20D35A